MAFKRKDRTLQSARWQLRRGFVPVAMVSLFINLLMLTGPIYMLQVYDRVLSSQSLQTLVALTVLVAGLYLVMMCLDAIRTSMLARSAALFDAKVSPAVFRANAHLQVRAPKVHEKADPVRDLDQCRNFLAGTGPIAMFDLPWMPVYLAIVFVIHPYLGLLATGAAGFLVLLMIVNNALSKAPAQEMAGHVARRSATASTTRNTPGATLGMGMLQNLSHLWAKDTQALLKAQTRGADRSGSLTAMSKSTRLMLQSAILGLGAFLVIQDQISAGMMIAASIITGRALAPLEQAINAWQGLVASRQAMERLAAVLDLGFEAPRQSAHPLPSQKLEVTNLFSGPDVSMVLLRGVSFTVEAGSGVGIIGPSGSGKTSLLNAILGLWPAVNGDIRLDGTHLDQWSRDRIGQAVGYLPQDVQLFEGSIAQNISRFDPEARLEDILAAANLAGVHQLITQLPMGYETVLGDAGSGLSAGQRQRIGLARALYRDPFLVLLDEPNANLDTAGEATLASAMQAVRDRGGIVLVVAHRPSALAAVDQLLMLKDGRQKLFGPRDEVMQKLNTRTATQQVKSNLQVVSRER